MAVYKLFPSKDASVYSAYPAMNTGLDAILDVSNLVTDRNPTAQVARSLIKFDQGEINDVLENIAKVTGSAAWGTWDAHLKMYVAKATNVIIDSKVEIYPISSSWNNGSGQYLDKIQNDTGVSWKFEDYSGSVDVWPAGGWSPSSTGSYDKNWDINTAISNGTGGSWWTGSSGFVRAGDALVITASQEYTLRSTKDLDVDVSDIVTMWYSSSGAVNIAGLVTKPNDGFLVKWEDSKEFVTQSAISPQLSYYSVDTNTIYPPLLNMKWEDYYFSTGSSTNKILGSQESFMSIYNNDGTYYSGSVARFRIAAIPKYPDVVFQTASLYTTNFYLPENSSSYAIKDTDTNEFVIEFDDKYTNISADATSSYFDVYMNGLEPERQYTVLIKSTIGGVTKVWDEDLMFKVING